VEASAPKTRVACLLLAHQARQMLPARLDRAVQQTPILLPRNGPLRDQALRQLGSSQRVELGQVGSGSLLR